MTSFRNQSEATEFVMGCKHALTEEEIQALLPWVNSLHPTALTILEAHLSLVQLQTLNRQITSFNKFDISTAKTNRWMLWFTGIVTFMTLVQTGLAVWSFHRGH
jgi:hypothetical protein